MSVEAAGKFCGGLPHGKEAAGSSITDKREIWEVWSWTVKPF